MHAHVPVVFDIAIKPRIMSHLHCCMIGTMERLLFVQLEPREYLGLPIFSIPACVTVSVPVSSHVCTAFPIWWRAHTKRFLTLLLHSATTCYDACPFFFLPSITSVLVLLFLCSQSTDKVAEATIKSQIDQAMTYPSFGGFMEW